MSDVFKALNNMQKINVAPINLNRAIEFREFTIRKLKAGQLGLMAIKPRTIANRKANLGGPLFDVGELAEGIKAKNSRKGTGKNAEAGYFKDDTEKHSDSDKTNFDLAVIHSDNKKRPRPFLLNSAARFEGSEDVKAVEEAFEEIWQSV